MSEIICRTDGACGTFCAGIGYHITGEVEASGHRVVDENITSMESELFALLEALRVASLESSDRKRIVIYTDCRPLKRKICGNPNERDDWESYRQSALWLLEKFESWDIFHCSRETTHEAHELARVALTEGRNS